MNHIPVVRLYCRIELKTSSDTWSRMMMYTLEPTHQMMKKALRRAPMPKNSSLGADILGLLLSPLPSILSVMRMEEDTMPSVSVEASYLGAAL